MVRETEKNREWTIRNAVGTDLEFIYSTWLTAFRYGSIFGKDFGSNQIYFNEYAKVIDYILSNPKTHVVIATMEATPHLILGYLVSEYPNIAHFCYVKEVFRMKGLAESLIEHVGGIKFYTHKTFSVPHILRSRSDIKYNPLLLYKTHTSSNGEINGKI